MHDPSVHTRSHKDFSRDPLTLASVPTLMKVLYILRVRITDCVLPTLDLFSGEKTKESSVVGVVTFFEVNQPDRGVVFC